MLELCELPRIIPAPRCAPGRSLGHRLPHAYQRTRLPVRVEAQGAGREQHHDRGTKQEAPHFLTPNQHDVLLRVVPFAHRARARWRDHAVPDRRHRADDGGADQHHDKGCSLLGLEHANHAFIACEQPGHRARRARIHREQTARHVHHAQQATGGRHVDAVIVARAQIQGREVTIAKAFGERGIATKQGRGRIPVPLGLHDPVPIDAAQLADAAVDRADQSRRGQRPGTLGERAREELVETCVASNVRRGRRRHIDPVARDETAYRPTCQTAQARRSEAANERGQCLFGQQILG